jgi:hypothetical protein
LTTLAASCATGSQYSNCPKDTFGNCQDGDPVSAALEMGVLTVLAGAHAVAQQPGASDARVAPVEPPLVGRVRWLDSREAVPAVAVTLHRKNGLVVPTTTTDEAGWFRFPFPLKDDWYTVSVDVAGAKGETTLWLQDRRPDALEVLVRRETGNAGPRAD